MDNLPLPPPEAMPQQQHTIQLPEGEPNAPMIYRGWRSTRHRTPVDRSTYAHAVEMTSHAIEGELLAPNCYTYPPILGNPLQAMSVSMEQDTMYLHEVKKKKDWKQFKTAMAEEIKGHLQNDNFKIISKDLVPKHEKVLPTVWAFRRKRRISNGEVYKWKARLNLDGSKQIEGIHFNESFAAVASWPTIRSMMAIALTNKWHTAHIDFVQAFPQAPIERTMYIKIPKGYEVNGPKDDYVLQVDKNIYGQVQTAKVWKDYLTAKLIKIGFKPYLHDECIFTKGKVIYTLYTNDSILMRPDQT